MIDSSEGRNAAMKFLLPFFIAIYYPASAAFAADLILLQDRKTEYQIVLPDQLGSDSMAASLHQVARLVQAALKANGAKISVVGESQRDSNRPAMLLGDTQFARAQGIDVTGLKDWSYVQRVVGRDIIIAGYDHPARGETTNSRRPNWDRVGTAKAVVDFLRQYLGVRFLYPEMASYTPIGAGEKLDLLASPAIEFLPLTRALVPADLDVMKTPLLRVNTSHPAGGSFYDLALNRFPRVDEVFGGHTWERAVPPDVYWESHPEYFAWINGQRLKPKVGAAQYCLSNPEVQELIYADCAGWLDRGFATVDLGQPDGFRACQCEACQKLFETGNDWSEKIWIFHRQIAERLQVSHPDREVSMMSYILTAQPPRTFQSFPPNTSIMLTGTNEEDFALWRDFDVPRGFTGYVYNWCPNLGTRYTPMRTPGFVESQAKRLAANRVQSLYRDGPGQLYGLEAPVYYVMGRMFDDPQMSTASALLTEFYEAAFGDKSAVFYMRAFYDRLYHAIEIYSNLIGTRCDYWTYQPSLGERSRKTVQDPFALIAFLYTPKLLEELESHLSYAEKQARSDKARTRISLVRSEFEYLKHFARVVHLYQAFHVQPDEDSKTRLLDAIDARNAFLDSLYDQRGNGKISGAWSHVLFPFPGHDAKHLRLAYDGYQEPYSNTCFNWDTRLLRNSPSTGIKRLIVAKAKEPVTLESPQWAAVESHELTFVVPLKYLPRSTVFRLLYDDNNLYLYAECELTPDHPTEFPKFPRDQPLELQESLSFLFQPQPSQEVYYRLAVGANQESKYDAASGLITEPLDPRFDKDDPDWNGHWQATSRIDPTVQRWQSMLAIPFSTFSVGTPSSGTLWRANIARNHLHLQGQIDRSIWSSSVTSQSIDDRSVLGELLFE